MLLPGHKADRFFEGSMLQIFPSSALFSPVVHFERYLQLRDAKFQWLPELWLLEDGSPPLQHWFNAQLCRFFPDNISGHSLHAGGATALAMAGVSDDQIRLQGRWSSDSYQIYLRKNPSVFLSTFNVN